METPWLHLRGSLAALAVAALVAACEDTAPATTPDAATDVAKDTATDVAPDVTQDVAQDTAPSRCASNADCAGNAGGAACDTATGRCVACVAASDTCPADQHCEDSSHTCVAGCRNDTGCAASTSDAGVADGSVGASLRCDVSTHTCVACLADEHCPAGMVCSANACVVGCNAGHACPAGNTCCSGACVDTASNADHCGACGAACAAEHGVPSCAASACGVASCTAPYGNCDGNAANGCETDTQTAVAHCGACGMACPARAHATTTCALGTCGFACEAGFADCDGDASNGCEVTLATDAAHCGACATACTVVNGSAACVAGACAIAGCSAGFADCDMSVASGCEVNTAGSLSHCGACGTVCPTPAAGAAVCAAGVCGVGSCDTGFADCNATAGDGCEVNTQTDAAHCGACGTRCAFANATASCAAGACALATCTVGFANCNMAAGDGCEVSTQTDARNCGACGNVCAEGAICAAGACQFGAGADGALSVTATTTLNTVAASASGASGEVMVTLSNVAGAFSAGQKVLLHQTQAATGPVGHYEYARVASVAGAALVLTAPLGASYVTDATHRAQVLVVPEYTDVSVATGGTLTAPAWNGNTGGVLAFDAAGGVSVAGSVAMSGAGFRGRNHACAYRCGRGYQGEGHLGLGDVNVTANGSGGGGGGAGQDGACGGGGSYGSAGANGTEGGCGACAEACPIPGGTAGAATGTANLAAALLLGGAGGEGGADEDGGNPGAGGNGGGIVLVRARSITVATGGAVSSLGLAGVDGNQTACGGTGCGMGGGGGGAGGAIRLVALSAAALGDGRVLASGAGGGAPTCGGVRGGAGGAGRVGIAGDVTGTTTPTFDAR